MINNEKISERQYILLITLFIVGSSILIIPASLAEDAKQNAWLAAILGSIIGIFLAWLYAGISQLFPELTLVQLTEKLLGKWFGKIVSLLFFSFIFILGSLILRNIGDFLTSQIMPDTPIQAIHILFLIPIIIGARMGIETLARLAELLFPWFILFFFILSMTLSPKVKLENIQPLFEGGTKPLMRSILTFVSAPFMELIVFLMITPDIHRTDKIKNSFISGTLIGGFLLTIIVILSILVLGPELTARNLYPSYALAKMINIGNFLQRIEIIMAIMWFISIFFNLVLCFYASSLGLSQIFNIQDYRLLTLPLGMIMLVISIIAYPNTAYFFSFFPKIWLPYALTFSVLIPLLLFLIAIFRRRRAQSLKINK
ncbi:endospore germination permease [Ammoniphilus sp. 3BR4]|uniref:GerAB/ArcD/ProY family transporter n=1 Tax=Ammoniphilus sp. 3BR4 TaxID=3158265 RepID=UPI0034668B3F